MSSSSSQVWAAVAVLLFPYRGRNATLLIRRPRHPKDPWSGHYAFPGGKLDVGEASFQAAIRETQEELGLVLDPASWLFSMPISMAGVAQGRPRQVEPHVFGLAQEPVALCPNPDEVDSMHFLFLDDLLDPSAVSPMSGLIAQDPLRSFPAFKMEQGAVWGFTLAVLLQLSRKLS